MNFRTFIRMGVLACAVTVLCAAPSWAVPVQLVVQNGGFPGFNATFLHENHTAGGPAFTGFKPLNGVLTADLDTSVGIKLSNIMGVMTGPNGTVEITDGMIDTNPGPNPSGYFDYQITDPGNALAGLALSGTLTFLASENANILNMSFLQLWGGDITNEDKGMDFRANIVPEPSTMILLGSGLIGLVGWRYRKSQA